MNLAASKERTGFFLYHTLWQAVDLLYPPHCAGCEKLGERWCSACQQQVEKLREEEICSRCGDVLKTGGICYTCIKHPPAFTALRSWGIFGGPLRKALHGLKYKQDIGLGESLSVHLADLLNHLSWPIDLVTAVPLGRQRYKERGYNQAAMLAWPTAARSNIPYASRVLERTRETHSQVGLTAQERLQNVHGAFRASPELVRGKNILIIDDVSTTGATLDAAAHAVCAAGASAAYALTLARAAVSTHTPDDEVTRGKDASL